MAVVYDEDKSGWAQGGAIATVSLTDAGGTYTTAEQNLINDLKAKLNAVLAVMRDAGLIALD